MSYWVRIERESGAVLAFGPYDTQDQANHAMEHALLIDAECQHDAVDCWADDTLPQPDEEQIIVDLTDPHHTGDDSP